MSKFNIRLKLLRNELSLSQAEFASRIGISKSSVNMYERGEREPGLETLEAIADFFNVDMDYLLGKSDLRNKTLLLGELGPLPVDEPTPPRDENVLLLNRATERMTPEQKERLVGMARLAFPELFD